MRVTGDVPSLLNGVSQQSPAFRLLTQSEAQVNRYSTLLAGNKLRPPTERVAEVSGGLSNFVHLINRDSVERYQVVAGEGALQVFDFSGASKTVAFPDGYAYLTGMTDPASEMLALTIADYTFLVNKTKKVAMNPAVLAPSRTPEAILNITSGNYGRTYQVRIDGAVAAEYATPVGDNSNQSPGVATTVIAEHLYRDLRVSLQNQTPTTDAGGVASTPWNVGGGNIASLGYANGVWGVGIHQNALHVTRYDGVDFTIAIDDGVGGASMKLAKDKIAKFSDLPQYGPHGFRIEVAGSNGTGMDNYWVWADKGGTDNNSKIDWRETIKSGTQLELDASTMPHVLVREADGTFTFKRATWGQRKCGDGVDISPDPSFVGRTIRDIYFHRNRFGILSDDASIMARSGDTFDFFRRSATALLDDDPIDVAASHIKVSLLESAVPLKDNLILFSGGTQFRLAGNELLTPKTASIRPLTEYSCAVGVKPVAMGSTIFFVADSPGSTAHAAIFEYSYDQKQDTIEAQETTSHCPAYIPSGVYKIIGNVDEGVLGVLSKADRSKMWLYRYYWQGGEKLQSSWSVWDFPGGEILGGASIHSDFYLVVRRGGNTYLERIRLDTAVVDDPLDLMVGLDQRTISDPVAFSGGVNLTRFNCLYPEDHPNLVVVGTLSGRQYFVKTTTPTYVDVEGLVEEPVYLGIEYSSELALSTIYYRESRGNSTVVRRDGRLQLQHLTLAFDKTAGFDVEITRDLRDPVVESFKAFKLDNPQFLLDRINPQSGRINIPIMGRNDRVTIKVRSSRWLPNAITGLSWRGIFAPIGREDK